VRIKKRFVGVVVLFCVSKTKLKLKNKKLQKKKISSKEEKSERRE
jgi:hypothetical protein